jgi:hypothetical protein
MLILLAYCTLLYNYAHRKSELKTEESTLTFWIHLLVIRLSADVILQNTNLTQTEHAASSENW